MKQAQAMQENMQRMQEEVAKMEVEGQSGGGMVKVTMTGKHEVRRVAAAINDASRRIEQEQQEKMSGMTAGMNLPPGFKMPF